MTDMLGNNLVLGDEVIFIAPGYRILVIGTIDKIMSKMISINYINNWNYSRGNKQTLRQFGNQVVLHTHQVSNKKDD